MQRRVPPNCANHQQSTSASQKQTKLFESAFINVAREIVSPERICFPHRHHLHLASIGVFCKNLHLILANHLTVSAN
jgi:hypothetical protein